MGIKFLSLCMSLILIGLVTTGDTEAQIAPEFIVGLWSLDEGNGGVAGDSSGNARDGIITGAEWDDGVFGDCLKFDAGDTVEVSLGDGAVTNELTVILWLQFMEIAGQQNYFSIWEGNNRYVPYKTGGDELHFWTNNWDAPSGFFIDADTWYHVANVYDGVTGSIYVNGELQSSTPGAFSLAGGGQQSAWFATDAGGWISSCIEDEIGIFSTALTKNEINGIMENGIGWALDGAPVESAGKLSTTWGNIKHN